MSSVLVRIDSGTSVGPYVVERRLAQGGMSVLYLARDVEGRRFVLKMVLPEMATSITRGRLMREARALAVVDHPGVVRVHGAGDHEGSPWLAMEYVEGTDLKRIVAERGPLPIDTALRYAIQAAEALVAAHDAGVIHRDLKPSNLLLTPDEQIVLVDFGIAKSRADSRDDELLTSEREVLGTLAYLSPEQLEYGLADERSDVWALGCVLYEMIVGAPPFGRGGQATTEAILRDEPQFPPYLSAGVAHVLGACLRKSSFARIASPRELVALLNDVLEEVSSPQARDASAVSVSQGVRRSGARSGSGRPPSLTSAASEPPSRASAMPARQASPSTRPPSARPPSSRPPYSSSLRIAVPRGRVKGTALRAGIAWFAQTYGEQAVTRVGELASPELMAILRPGDPTLGLMASGWYDTQLIGELLTLLEKVARPLDPENFAARLAEAVAKDNVGGVYRSLFRLIASPDLLEANAQRVWRTYVDEGTMSVQVTGRRSFLAYVRGWSSHDGEVCRMLRPLFQQLLRAIGYADLEVERMACIDGGAEHCMFAGHWQ